VAAVMLLGFGATALLAGEEEWKPQGEGWVQLFNGKDLTGWKFKGGTNTSWEVQDGVLANLRKGVDIFTERTFDDFQLHIEFKVPKAGNSGVYLRGRKEIQIDDAFGKEKPGSGNCGGVYSKAAPSVNACKPAGEWNTFDITIVENKLTVVHNGKTIHDGVEVPGNTGGAMAGKDGDPGPLMLQGDHTAVSYRNIWIKPLPKQEKKEDK
jgi:hypothetical protein